MKTMKHDNIDVVVLCGGKGTRLRSVIRDRPKPMADIGGKPFLAELLDYVAKYGFHRFILCAGYKAQDIRSFFERYGRNYEVEFSEESKPIGTGGALRNALPFIHSDMCLVLNGDSFCAVEYEKLLIFHAVKSALVTIAVSRMKNAGEYGRVIIARDGAVKAFEEKATETRDGWVNSGVYVFNKSIVEAMKEKTMLSLEREVFPMIVGNKLYGFKSSTKTWDIGTPERYVWAQKNLASIFSRSI
jgi:NDP-sugar pyrophosphorylase family protein